jgi:long-chain acyl-CoA synthetase
MQGTIVSGARCLSHVDLIDALHGPRAASAPLASLKMLRLRSRCEDDFALLEVAFGAAHLGAYGVPVNWHFAAEDILRDCAARALVVHTDLCRHVTLAIPEGITVFAAPAPRSPPSSVRLASQLLQ